MIYYFTGTGNSKWMAKQIAELSADQAESMIKKTGEHREFAARQDDDVLGFVFPVYAWLAPEVVVDFIKSTLPIIKPDTYTFAVITCGEEIGKAAEKLKSRLPFDSVFSVVMPNNYIIGKSDADDEILQQEKRDKARITAKTIAEVIKQRGKVSDIEEGAIPAFKSAVIGPLFNRFGRFTKSFSVGENCIGCGVCEKNCPKGCIKLENGKPTWTEEKCYLCLCCINGCKACAIERGQSTKGKKRYCISED